MATINPWKQFSGLLPKAQRGIGTVVSHGGNGASRIRLRDDSTLIVSGQEVEVGMKVLVEDGKVVREVPDLPIYEAQL